MKTLLFILLLPLCIYAQGIEASRIRKTTFARLGTPADSNERYCTDCAATSPCTGSGTGAKATRVNGAWNCSDGGAGTGTVTSVSVTTANGVSGSVATATTTPAITLTLGAITPSSIVTPLVTLGTVSTTTGLLKFANSASPHLTIIQAGNAAAARTYTWPTNFGAAGAALTDAAGDGTLSWVVPSSSTGANPSASVGLTAVNGSAATFLRSDSAPALDQSIAPTWTGQHIFSLNSAASTPPVKITGTWFTGGSATTTKPHLLIEPTGTTSTGWSTNGTGLGVNGASGFAGNLLDLQVAGASAFSVGSAGDIAGRSLTVGTSISVAGNSFYNFSGRGYVEAPADGVFKIENQAANDFGRLQFGGTSSSYPSIKRNGTIIALRLADDSADAGFSAGASTLSSTVTLSTNLTNAAGTPGSLCYNTTTFEVTKNNALTCTVSNPMFKSGIAPFAGNALSLIDRLHPIRFAYRDHPDRGRWGFSSTQVASVDRRLADGYNAAGEPMSLDQNAILALTVKAVQELKAQVSAQQLQIAAQQKQIRRLSRRH